MIYLLCVMLGATVGFCLFAIVSVNRANDLKSDMHRKIEAIQKDFDQERKGFAILLKIRDEEINRLKMMLKERGKQ